MTNSVKHLLEPDIITIFDCDGVLAIYEIGEHRHLGCTNDKWPEYVKENRPYDTVMPVPQMQAFIRDKGIDNSYVCTRVASEAEKEQKLEFIYREYGIPFDHICFVNSTDEKIEYMREIANERCGGNEEKVALVEDTVTTIDAIYETSNFLTVHISSFFTYTPLIPPEMDDLAKTLRQQISQYQRRADEMKEKAPTLRCCEHERLRSKARSYEHALAMVEGREY